MGETSDYSDDAVLSTALQSSANSLRRQHKSLLSSSSSSIVFVFVVVVFVVVFVVVVDVEYTRGLKYIYNEKDVGSLSGITLILSY